MLYALLKIKTAWAPSNSAHLVFAWLLWGIRDCISFPRSSGDFTVPFPVLDCLYYSLSLGLFLPLLYLSPFFPPFFLSLHFSVLTLFLADLVTFDFSTCSCSLIYVEGLLGSFTERLVRNISLSLMLIITEV